MPDGTATISVNLNGAEEATEKAKQLCDAIREAKSLANDLASLLADMKLEVEV